MQPFRRNTQICLKRKLRVDLKVRFMLNQEDIINEQEEMFSLKEFCCLLSVSEATGRNWLRLGRIASDRERNGKPYFSQTYAQQFLAEVKNGSANVLKNRRNKKYVDGCGVYSSYLSESSKNSPVVSAIASKLKDRTLTQEQLREVLGECALQLFCQREGKTYDFTDNYVRHYLQGEIVLEKYDSLIRDLLGDKAASGDVETSLETDHLFAGVNYYLEQGQDILGMLYLSLKNLGMRKAAGAYYTPLHIVQKLLELLRVKEDLTKKRPLKILDPCCGTGNFLLQLIPDCRMEELYGSDIDPLAVQIARINLAIACPETPVSLIRERIQVRDFLRGRDRESYDVILGNPPWGGAQELTSQQLLKEKFLTGKSGEVYDLFLEQSLRRIKSGGVIAFVLPEAVLYVKSHQQIRALLAEQAQIQNLNYVGNVFHQVQCPAVIVKMQKTGKPLDTCGMKICRLGREFEITASRIISAECFNFHMPDDEYEIFHKIEQRPDVAFLKGQADFALGIVTGNNKKYLQEEKTAENEIVLKGSDIEKYVIRQAKQYLRYEPQYFQQTAPEGCYRAKEKLLYRFIGKNLVFAYDDRQRLSLNSCNILLPRIPGMDMKYVLAVLNSRTAQFLYDRKFCSLKVLRSYLEKIPLPVVSETEQQEIIFLSEKIMSAESTEMRRQYYSEADQKIAFAYGLTEAEYLKICKMYP